MKEKKLTITQKLEKFDSIKEENIDYSDIPELELSDFENIVEMPRFKQKITLRLDQDVLDWFKDQGKGYQTKINAVLKTYMKIYKKNHIE